MVKWAFWTVGCQILLLGSTYGISMIIKFKVISRLRSSGFEDEFEVKVIQESNSIPKVAGWFSTKCILVYGLGVKMVPADTQRRQTLSAKLEPACLIISSQNDGSHHG